jgi:hypothetical protein
MNGSANLTGTAPGIVSSGLSVPLHDNIIKNIHIHSRYQSFFISRVIKNLPDPKARKVYHSVNN